MTPYGDPQRFEARNEPRKFADPDSEERGKDISLCDSVGHIASEEDRDGERVTVCATCGEELEVEDD